jgi:sugar-specific transcriptional regulator TrmB
VTNIIPGANEYESRAYRALLGADALTAYQLGQAAAIPLSRSYEVARALVAKGLAEAQPGETPRYRAIDPLEMVARRRRELARDLDALADELTALAAGRAARSGEPVWVLRGAGPILARASALIDAAERSLTVRVPEEHVPSIDAALERARARGVALHVAPAPALLLLRDRAEALIGDLAPAESCLATHLSQPAAVALLAGEPVEAPAPHWLAWEEAKVRGLLSSRN